MNKSGIVLSKQTFDRFDEASRRVTSPGVRAESRANFQSPVVQFLKIVAGSTNANGYPAYVQGTSDGGVTWANIGTTNVRVRTVDSTTLEENDYVHARFAGMNATGEACFVAVAFGSVIEIDYIAKACVTRSYGNIDNITFEHRKARFLGVPLSDETYCTTGENDCCETPVGDVTLCGGTGAEAIVPARICLLIANFVEPSTPAGTTVGCTWLYAQPLEMFHSVTEIATDYFWHEWSGYASDPGTGCWVNFVLQIGEHAYEGAGCRLTINLTGSIGYSTESGGGSELIGSFGFLLPTPSSTLSPLDLRFETENDTVGQTGLYTITADSCDGVDPPDPPDPGACCGDSGALSGFIASATGTDDFSEYGDAIAFTRDPAFVQSLLVTTFCASVSDKFQWYGRLLSAPNQPYFFFGCEDGVYYLGWRTNGSTGIGDFAKSACIVGATTVPVDPGCANIEFAYVTLIPSGDCAGSIVASATLTGTGATGCVGALEVTIFR